jgi:hypothetical protein
MTSGYWHQLPDAVWTPDDERQYQDGGRSRGSRSTRAAANSVGDGNSRAAGTTRQQAPGPSSQSRSSSAKKTTASGR